MTLAEIEALKVELDIYKEMYRASQSGMMDLLRNQREEIAKSALQGMLSNSSLVTNLGFYKTRDDLTSRAVELSDMLIAKLAQKDISEYAPDEKELHKGKQKV